MAIITDTKARNLKPHTPQVAHGGVVGLVLIPSKTKGRGKWVLRYVSPLTGKRRNAGLGTYPEVSIAEAGKVGSAMRELIAKDKDPLEAINLESPPPSVPCFKAAATTLHAELLPSWKNVKHGKQWISTITTFAIPEIGDLTLDQIEPKHIANVLRPIWLTKPETASRLKQRLHAVMAWGWAHGHCKSNPVDVVHLLLPQQPGKAARTQHQPAMPWAEIPKFYKEHLNDNQPETLSRRMLEFLILSACRSGEVRGMRWDEVDLTNQTWTIPAERMKAKQPHRVPLTPRMLQILSLAKGLHDLLVFPSPRDKVEFSDMALTELLRGFKAVSDDPKRHATAHGFRSSFRDWCSEKGVLRDLAERSLAHTIANKVEAAYHRTDLLDKRRELMTNWEKHCLSLVAAPVKNDNKIIIVARRKKIVELPRAAPHRVV